MAAKTSSTIASNAPASLFCSQLFCWATSSGDSDGFSSNTGSSFCEAAVLAREPGQVVAANNLADALNAYGCRSLALQTIDAAIQAAGPSHALGKVFEQTRAEILAGGTRPEESAECATWARMPR